MIQPNDPIHPITCENDDRGLTKREHFAALALQGLLTNQAVVAVSNKATIIHTLDPDGHARAAVALADALINALNAPKESPNA